MGVERQFPDDIEADAEADMAKSKGGSYPNPKGHTGPKMQFPQAKRPAGGNTAPRVVPRTRASPKGR